MKNEKSKNHTSSNVQLNVNLTNASKNILTHNIRDDSVLKIKTDHKRSSHYNNCKKHSTNYCCVRNNSKTEFQTKNCNAHCVTILVVNPLYYYCYIRTLGNAATLSYHYKQK